MSLKIDIHHHIFAPFFMEAKLDSAKKVGWRTPAENLPWSLSNSLAIMDHLSIGAAILSYPAGIPEKMGQRSVSKPGSQGGDGDDWDEIAKERGRDAVRKMNVYAKELCESEEAQGRFGWFSCLPDLRDVEGSLREIQYALDTLRADGVSLSSSYGEGSDGVYLGESRFDAIWEELNNRSAVVFIHGTQTPSSKPYPHECLGLPVTEVPSETFKAAAHLVVTGTKRRYPKVNIILAHFGGNVGALIPRVAALSAHMGSVLTAEEIIEDLCSFYLDSALSAHESTLRHVEGLVGRGRMLFGTDYPGQSGLISVHVPRHN
ncbi:hypothetical protein BDY19DRAFT_574059 [Irpex rosettiformis]|uniref:Uncharacterized protein n=1 Tax=Irpex rosettiformis TaxID=378272 RepID=A0ACB8UCR2_9APHY|nr:hypothetical protein BDY19DRAFT_574059 [Irpex rosettiformis]